MPIATDLVRFDECLKFTLKQEGGFSDTPGDHGGATNFGITISTFRHWLHDEGASVQRLKDISQAERDGIYYSGYWTPPQCGALPIGADLMVFDFCVNAGPRASVYILQRLLGVKVDGLVGPLTIAAAAQGGRSLIEALGGAQVGYYRALVQFPLFGHGWLARTNRRTDAALLAWDAAAALAPAPTVHVTTPVAVPPDPVAPPVPTLPAPVPAATTEATPMVEINDVVGGALKGAAAGMVLGPVGAAGGAALGLAVQLVPQLTRWLAGDGGVTVAKVIGVVEQATGTTNGAAQVAAAADPEVASALGLQLAQIAADREADHETAQNVALVAVLGDTANARAQTLGLATQGSVLAWGSPVVSVIVLLAFGTLTGIITFHAVPEGSQQIANIMLGSLGTMAANVVGYWVGSSVGSARKTDLLAKSVPATLLPVPAAIVPAADVKETRNGR